MTGVIDGAIIALIKAPFTQRDLMAGRPKTDEPYIQTKINIPSTLAARFALLHQDPVTKKVAYGAYSNIITELLLRYVETEEISRGLRQP